MSNPVSESEVLTLPEKQSFYLLEYKYDTSFCNSKRYCTNNEDYFFDGFGPLKMSKSINGKPDSYYLSSPEIEVKKLQITGGFNEKPFEAIHIIDDFFYSLINIVVAKKIELHVYEITRFSPFKDNIIKIFCGKVTNIIGNPSGNNNTCKVLAANIKTGDIEVPGGLVATSTCKWALGQNGACRLRDPADPANPNKSKDSPYISLEMKTETIDAIISSIDGKTIQFQSVPDRTYDPAEDIETNPDGHPHHNQHHFWLRGYIEKDGVRILIRDWEDGDPDNFRMMKEVPSSWLGSVVKLSPGCVKTQKACKQWHNIKRFGAYGIGITSRHPIFEEA